MTLNLTEGMELNGAQRASTSTLDRSAAAVLEDPMRKWTSDVNWLINLDDRSDDGSTNVRGLWSVTTKGKVYQVNHQ